MRQEQVTSARADTLLQTPFSSSLFVHTSETHDYSLASNQPVFLHTHTSGPYPPSLRPTSSDGLNLTIHIPEPSCEDVAYMFLSVDRWASEDRHTISHYVAHLELWNSLAFAVTFLELGRPAAECVRIIGRIRQTPDASVDNLRRVFIAPVGTGLPPWCWERDRGASWVIGGGHAPEHEVP